MLGDCSGAQKCEPCLIEPISDVCILKFYYFLAANICHPGFRISLSFFYRIQKELLWMSFCVACAQTWLYKLLGSIFFSAHELYLLSNSYNSYSHYKQDYDIITLILCFLVDSFSDWKLFFLTIRYVAPGAPSVSISVISCLVSPLVFQQCSWLWLMSIVIWSHLLNYFSSLRYQLEYQSQKPYLARPAFPWKCFLYSFLGQLQILQDLENRLGVYFSY